MTRVTDTGEAGYDVYVEQPQADALRRALAAAGVPAADPETAEAIRIEAGVPKFNLDMDAETIPLEAGIEARAISLSKGCYVGQEVIIRVLHRGHGRVARKLVGLALAGAVVPASGADVTVESRVIGHVTSSTTSPALERPIALAYLHRDFLAPGTSVSVAGQPAVVTALPFVAIAVRTEAGLSSGAGLPEGATAADDRADECPHVGRPVVQAFRPAVSAIESTPRRRAGTSADSGRRARPTASAGPAAAPARRSTRSAGNAARPTGLNRHARW